MMYKNYCDRRTARHTQEPEDTHCCPSRMPIIGPILFSLFIFSPLIFSTSDADKNTEFTQDAAMKENILPSDDPSTILEMQHTKQHQPLP